MNEPLIVRYTSDWPAPFTPGAEVLYEGPHRERQMVDLAQRQVDIQYKAAREIVESNLEAAEIIANEISRQTSVLAEAIEEGVT